LVKKYGFIHFSAGDLLREESKKETDEGKMIADIIKNGKIVPGHITIRLLKKAIARKPNNSNFLIDGFPREMVILDFKQGTMC
jgi:adenylate kinase family enzyme